MTAAPPQKISSAEINEHFQRIELGLDRMVAFGLKRPPLLIYKPRKSGDGKAMKMDLNITPTFVPNSERIAGSSGGLFLEVVDQAGERNGYPAFAWGGQVGDQKIPQGSITVKLGVPDITTLLAGIRHIRYVGAPELLPIMYRNQKQNPDPTKLVMVHKFDNNVSIISYKFTQEGSFLKISKSRDYLKSISLSLAEEVAFEEYLRGSLQQFLNTGLR